MALLGPSPLASFISGYVSFLVGLFLHTNVRTPHWIGYILQRPEMHAIHHQRGVHAYNYCIPLFDMLFGGGDQQDELPPAPVVTKPKKAALPAPGSAGAVRARA